MKTEKDIYLKSNIEEVQMEEYVPEPYKAIKFKTIEAKNHFLKEPHTYYSFNEVDIELSDLETKIPLNTYILYEFEDRGGRGDCWDIAMFFTVDYLIDRAERVLKELKELQNEVV